MPRRVEQRGARRTFHDSTAIQHQDLVAQVTDDGEVVADEQQREAVTVAQFPEQVDDLRLHRHVERAHRLVADQEPRPGDDGARDRRTLALPAAQLVRVARAEARVEADFLERGSHPGIPGGAALPALEGDERLRHALRDVHARIETADRVLEDHLHLAPHAPQPDRVVEQHGRPAPLDRASRRLEQTENRARQRRLAAARFAHDAERLTGCDFEVHAIDGDEPAAGVEQALPSHGETHREIANPQQPVAHGRASRGSSGAWQATTRSPKRRRSGRSVRHREIADGQRGAKAQPARSSPGRGG